MWPFTGVNHYDDYGKSAFWRKKNFNKFSKKKILTLILGWLRGKLILEKFEYSCSSNGFMIVHAIAL